MTEHDRIADAMRKMADDIQEAYRYQGGGEYAHRLRALAALVLMTRPTLTSSDAKQSGST